MGCCCYPPGCGCRGTVGITPQGILGLRQQDPNPSCSNKNKRKPRSCDLDKIIESWDSKKYLCTEILRSIIDGSEKVETTKVCPSVMNEQNVIEPNTRILFSLEREGEPDTCYKHG